MIYAGSLVFTPPQHAVDLRDFSQWWTFSQGANWRHPYGPKSNINALDNHPVVHVAYQRRARLRAVGRQRTADRSRMGICGARRARWRRICVGRRVHAGWPPHGQHLAGRIPAAKHQCRWLRAYLAGHCVSAERLRAARHDRQRLGMDHRLVLAEARGRRAESVLHPGKSARRTRGRQLRPANDQRQNSTQGHQRRLALVRAELLPPLPAGCAPCGAGRHVHEPCGFSMRQARSF